MDDGDGPLHRIVDDDRHAVGDAEHERHAGKVGHDGVRMGQGIGITAGTAADLCRSHGDDVVFVGLLGRRQLLQGIAQEGTEAAPVLQDGLGLVADVEP